MPPSAASPSLYLGLDCGGTSTRAVAARADGTVVGVGKAGASNPNVAGVEGTAGAIAQAVAGALAQAGATASDVAHAFVGMAGVVGDEDLPLARKVLGLAGLPAAGIDHDVRIALAGGLTGEHGLALIVGTGSACYGRNAAGKSWQAGGWGSILDDGGSGYGLGMAAMRASVRIADGRLPKSDLLGEVMEGLNITTIRQIVRRVYQEGVSKTEVASLAPRVIKAFVAGDAVARDLVYAEAGELSWIIETAARELAFPAPKVVYTGGLIEKSEPYRAVVLEVIKKRVPTSHLQPRSLAPVLGAVLLAYGERNVRHNATTHDRLRDTLAGLDA